MGKLCGVERLGRADVADGLLVSIVDHAPENALRAHLPVLRVPRVPAFGHFAGESTDTFAARAERDGAWRRSVAAEFPASFAEVQHLGALRLTLGILFGPEDTEISIRHLVGSLAQAQAARDRLYDNPTGPLAAPMMDRFQPEGDKGGRPERSSFRLGNQTALSR